MVLNLLITFSLFVLQVIADVKVTSQDYICKGDLNLVESQYGMENPACDQYWSYQDNSVGTLLDLKPECNSPCKELTAGKILLTECVNITLAVICTKIHLGTSWTIESRIHFYGKMNPCSRPNSVKRANIGAYISIGALIIISSLLGLLYHQNRNNEVDVTNE